MSEDQAPPEAKNNEDEVTFPVTTIDAALPHLRRPFAAAAVKWKIQATWSKDKNGPATGAIVIGYIDARLVSARLNKVVGGNWSEKPVRVADQPNALMYELTVFEQTHVDVGLGQGRDAEMKLKAVHSDALKRSGVRFGIGEYLYAMPQFTFEVTEKGDELSDGTPTLKRRKDGKVTRLGDKVEAALRKLYEEWVKGEGEEAFGKPLDHGDAAAGSVGEGIEPGEEDAAEQTVASAPLEDEKAKELGEAARKLRDQIREVDEDALAQQSFDAAMSQREHSHERLEDFVGNLTELLADVKRFGELQGELSAVLTGPALKKVVDKANRRASRRERVEVLTTALAEAGDAVAAGKGGGSNA